MILLVLTSALLLVVTLAALRVYANFRSKLFRDAEGKRRKTFAFFHPYCNAGGGGERVLWVAVRSIQKRYILHPLMFLIYTQAFFKVIF